MGKARLLFVYPPDGDTVGEIIDLGESISDGKPGVTLHDLPCHVAIIRCDGQLQEALAGGVTYTDLSKYSGVRTRAFALDVPDLASGEKWADEQDGCPYSKLSCAEAEVFALTGQAVDCPQEGTDCSQLGINYVRNCGRPLLGDEPAALVRPSDLLDEVITQGGEELENL